MTITGTLSICTKRLVVVMATSGLAWLSTMIASSLQPLTPPAALMSSTAHFSAWIWSMPNTAEGPVSGSATPNFKGSVQAAAALPAIAKLATATTAASRRDVRAEDVTFMEVLGEGGLREGSARGIEGMKRNDEVAWKF